MLTSTGRSGALENGTIHGLLEELAAASPDAVAVVWDDGQLTYGELNERANRTAHTIRQFYQTMYDRPFPPDTPIGIHVNQGPNMIVGLLAILKAGGAYMPLDPAYPESRLRLMMEDARSPLVLTEQALLEHLLFLDEGDYGVICLDGGWERIARQSAENPVPITGSHSLAFLFYTSGSTGQPKGVMGEHHSVVHLVRSQNYIEIRPSDCFAQTANLSFDAATFEIWGALLNGARVAVIDRSALLSSDMLAAAQRRHGVTIQFFTTAVFNLLADGDAEALVRLRVALFGGEEANAAKVRHILACKTGGMTLVHVYGPTECTTFSTFCVLSDKHRQAPLMPIGEPLARMYGYVLNDNLQLVSEDQTGELYMGGDGVTRGYLNRPELTAERFILNPYATAEQKAAGVNLRLYKTGDIVKRLPSGGLIYVARADNQIKIRGFRVELGEIEATLLTHPKVKDCVVMAFGVSHQKRLVAYAIPDRKGTLDTQELFAHLAKTLPAYMIPSVFVEMESFPLNPNGKVDRRALPPPFGGTQTLERPRGRQPGQAEPAEPRDDLERTLRDIVAGALNLETIGIDESIFSYGAHSLIVAQICASVRHQLRAMLEPKEIFDHPTVAGMARLVADRKSAASEDEVAIPKASRSGPIPLTYQQEQIWFLSKLVPDNRAYNSQFSVRLRGPLDKNILLRSLNEIVRRHEILRTTFHEQDGSPVQIVHEPWDVQISEVDLRHLPEDRRWEASEQRIDEELNVCFDFGRLPLIRWLLYRLGEEDWVLLHIEHHFLHDGWEIGVFLRELKDLYVAILEGRESPLEALPIQYADYAIWQKKTLRGTRLEEKVRYWIDAIRDHPQVLNLHVDHPRPAVQTFHGDCLRFNLDRDLYRSLREFSRGRNATLFMTMYSAFAVLLSRYSGQDRFLVGTGVANRGMKETENMLGMFVNAVLLHSDVSDNPSFTTLVDRTRQSLLEDAKHYDTPFPAIVERLKAGNKPGRNPLFQVIFAFHDSAVPLMDFAGIKGTLLERHNKTAKTDMNLICIPRAEQHVAMGTAAPSDEDLTLIWEYNSDLFDKGTIEQMISHYTTLLRAVVHEPQKRIGDLTMIADAEQGKLLEFAVGERGQYATEKTIPALFEEQVRRHPDKTAVVHNRRSLTYAELNSRANRLARQLQDAHRAKLGAPLEAGTHVGLCVNRGIDMVVAMLAILKAGGAYVTVSPEYPETRLRFMLADAGIKVILSQTDAKDRVPWLWQGDWKVIAVDADAESDAHQPQGNLECISRSSDTAYVIYTSGSTGIPKGVCVPHRAIHSFATNTVALHYSENSVIAQMANHAFDAATFEIWGALVNGAKMVVIDSDTVLNPDRLLATMEENAVTVAFFTTALFNLLAENRIEVLTRLECVHFGGEMANPSCVKKVLSQKKPRAALLHVYGPTECTTYSTACELTGKHANGEIMPIGRPLRNYTTYVLDEHLRLAPVGVPGELYIGGDSVALGYLNQPELTEERFVPNPFATEFDRKNGINLRLYRTGDQVRWLPDGTIHILGRIDFQVKIRGFRIEPEEVERVLLEHPGVKQCVVIPWEGHLVAYWVPSDPTNVASQSDLRSFLATQMPEYMVPSGFIETERFELNRNAKIDRTKLPPPSLGLMTAKKGDCVGPRNETENTLARIWRDLLRIDTLGVHDSFFDLGGTSILVVQMLDRVKRVLGADINVSSLFAMPTIAAMSAHIDKSAPADPGGEDNLALALKDAKTELPFDVHGDAAGAGHPRHVLLTGVTGFLGFHLLDKLLASTEATVHCLVRAADQDGVRAKFRDALRFFGRPDLERNPRIVLHKADLKKSALGLPAGTVAELADIVDQIYHCGAFVHHMFDYRTLRDENVQSTVELMKIASTGRRKVFNFISTLSVGSRRDNEGKLVEVDLGERPISTNGYVMTKWAAERILLRQAEKGLRVNIFRPGNITGHSATGICPPEKNHALLLVKGCFQMKCAPNWKRAVEMTPVDTLAEAIVKLSLHNQETRTFNMNNPLQMEWAEYVAALARLGFGMDLVSLDEWRGRLEGIDETNALFPLRAIYLNERTDFIEPESHPQTSQDSSTTQKTLQDLGVLYPREYARYLPIVVDYLKKTGFFPTTKK
jgi:amino acid adenylation domain-containing protein/thioester reductase-like protein